MLGSGLAVGVLLFRWGLDPTPVLLLGAVYFLLHAALQGKGLPGIGTAKKFEVLGGGGEASLEKRISFSDIGGQQSAKREFIEALEFIKNEDRAQKLGIRPLKGILLTGPPGTGKTLLARAAAAYTDSVFVSASGSEFVEMYAGVGAQRVRQLFERARSLAERTQKKSAIVFIDEIDVLGEKRGHQNGHREYDQTLNQLLTEMDGLRRHDKVRLLVVAATNRLEALDPALLRPGRFDRIVRVDLPDREGRLHILQIHTRDKPLAPDVDLEEIARETFGFSGAHLESLANEAAIQALRAGRTVIEARDFKEAIDKVIMGEKLDRRPRDEELRRIACHEAGHALVSEWLRPGFVSAITITSRGRALGYMRLSPQDDRYMYTREELLDQIAICLAGAVAEEISHGSRSTGAQGDFEEAVRIAKQLVEAGLSPLGVVSKEDLPPHLLHRTVRQILSQQEERARAHLRHQREALELVVKELLREERLSGERFRFLLGQREKEEKAAG